mgnify:CR=1 FL=1
MIQEKDIAKVEVGLTGHEMDPDDVTKIVGLHPTRSFRKGDRVSKKGIERAQPFSLWALGAEGEDVEATVRLLLAQLEGRLDAWNVAIKETKAQASVSIWWEPEGGQGGFTVQSALMRRLTEFGERVNIYFPG